MVLVDREGVFVQHLAQGLSMRIDRRQKLLLELDPHRLLHGLQAPATHLRFDKLDARPDENAGQRAQQLDFTLDGLGRALLGVERACTP